MMPAHRTSDGVVMGALGVVRSGRGSAADDDTPRRAFVKTSRRPRPPFTPSLHFPRTLKARGSAMPAASLIRRAADFAFGRYARRRARALDRLDATAEQRRT